MSSTLVQEVLGRLDDGWSLDELEVFIDHLRLDEDRAAALWLLAWLDRPAPGRPSPACPEPA